MAKNSVEYGYGCQAFRILQVAFVIIPLLAGLDKFLNLLTDWSQYLSPFVLQIINYRVHGFMMLVGMIEIVAGIGMMIKPKIFSYIVCIWLLGIIANLLLTGHYFDIALRDIGLLLAALALARLSHRYN